MAVRLVSEVVAYITGSDLTAGERVVLLVIAEQASSATREAWQSFGDGGKRRWVLTEVSGMSVTGLRTALQRLARRGIEVRVPIGKDKIGRFVYALQGRQTTYRLPHLADLEGDAGASASGDVSASASGDAGASSGDAGASSGDAGASPFPSATPSAFQQQQGAAPKQLVLNRTDARPSEADAVLARIQNERTNIRNLGGLVHHLAGTGELQTLVNQVRAARILQERNEAERIDREARRGMPKCEHGKEGGTSRHAVPGYIRCTGCDRAGLVNNARAALRLVNE